jgi:hypothetical protein
MGTRGRSRQLLLPQRIFLVAIALLYGSLGAQAPPPDIPQNPSENAPDAGSSETSKDSSAANQPKRESHRILGILPDYRSSPSLTNYEPLTSKEKFKIAGQDSFDRGTIILAAMFGGLGQLKNSNPSFGQGVPGFARYFGASYADYVIGDYMTEGIYPTILHQDPRYFRRGAGNKWSRLGYAMGQIFWTHKDSGGMQFNYSEILGNSTAVAISNAYYPDNRTASQAVSRLGVQLGVDMASNILKEFAPELNRMFSHRRHTKDVASP